MPGNIPRLFLHTGVRLCLRFNLTTTTSSPLGSYHAALQLQPLFTTHTLYTTTYKRLKIKDYFQESNLGLPGLRTGRLFHLVDYNLL